MITLLVLRVAVLGQSHSDSVRKPPASTRQLLHSDTTHIHQNLDTATITARRILVTPRIDGFSFDARQIPQAAGEIAADLLRKLPGVQIDEQGNPVIRGSSQVKLFIDGRPSEAYASTVAEALKLIPADNVARVEVITHPSARYDAEGVDAVINIFTKKRLADGASGSLNGRLDSRSSQFQALGAWRKHRWVMNADASRYQYNYNSLSILDRTDRSSGNHLQQTQEYNDRTHIENAGVIISYISDSLTTMNLRYQFGQGHRRSLIDYDNAFDSKDSFRGGYSLHTDNPAHRHIHTVNWGLFGASRRHTLDYDLMATWFDLHRVSDYVQTGAGAPTTSHNTVDNRELVLQGDLTMKLNPHITLETGAKAAFRSFSNQNLITPDTAHSNQFYFHRAILAAYATYTVSIHDWKLRIGARYEQTHWPLHFADTSLTPPDYKNFLPDATLSYDLSHGQSLSAGYSRKLIRPYIDNLNPVVNYLDSLNIEYGNPSLRPAFSNNYELNYSYRRTAWLATGSLFLRQTLHSIQNLRILQPGGIIASTYANIADNYVSGLTANLFYQPKKLTLNWSNTISYLVFNSVDYPQRRGYEFSTGVDVSCKATPTLSFSGMGYYYTGSISLQGSRTGWRNYAVMVNKDLPNTGLGFSFRIESLFAHYQYITERTMDETFMQSTLNRYINRYFKVGFTWKFGKKDIKTPTSRIITNDN